MKAELKRRDFLVSTALFTGGAILSSTGIQGIIARAALGVKGRGRLRA